MDWESLGLPLLLMSCESLVLSGTLTLFLSLVSTAASCLLVRVGGGVESLFGTRPRRDGVSYGRNLSGW